VKHPSNVCVCMCVCVCVCVCVLCNTLLASPWYANSVPVEDTGHHDRFSYMSIPLDQDFQQETVNSQSTSFLWLKSDENKGSNQGDEVCSLTILFVKPFQFSKVSAVTNWALWSLSSLSARCP
jgi:hypothetical protein